MFIILFHLSLALQIGKGHKCKDWLQSYIFIKELLNEAIAKQVYVVPYLF